MAGCGGVRMVFGLLSGPSFLAQPRSARSAGGIKRDRFSQACLDCWKFGQEIEALTFHFCFCELSDARLMPLSTLKRAHSPRAGYEELGPG